MNEHLCGCGRPTPDATICAACGYDLDAALAEITAYRGLGYDLDIQLAHRTTLRLTPDELAEEKRVPGVLAATPLPYSPRAADAAHALKAVLVGWARVVMSEQNPRPLGPTCRRCRHSSCETIRWPQSPPDSITGIATWLRPRAGWLRHHPAGQEAHDTLVDAVRDARRACDRPADRLYAGPCDCGADLYAKLGAPYVTCNSDAHEHPVVWEVEARRSWLLKSAENVLATTTEISRALTRYAQPVTPSALRGYVHRGQLAAKGERTEEGRASVPLYRVGDVLAILARQAERMSA